MAAAAEPIVFVVSDSAGETGESVVRAVSIQFSPLPITIHRVSFVRSEADIDQVIREARDSQGLIVYTLVLSRLHDHMARQVECHGVPAVDVLEPLLLQLEHAFQRKARRQPGILHRMDEDYFKKMEAVEFAVNYDDGRDPTGVLKADIVLIGVSRTSKTPLSMYLAHRMFKVANVPLVPELKPPKELFLIDPRKVIGLTLQPEKLIKVRKGRLQSLGLEDSAAYASDHRIHMEVEHAESIMKQLNCDVIDVTDKAVEETATIILERFLME